MKKTIKKRTRAPGGGRKPSPPGERRVVRSFSIAPETLAFIDREAKLRKLPAGRVVDGLIPE